MKTTEVRKKLKKIDALVREWSMYENLIKASEKCLTKGLDINKEMLENAKKRQDRISDEFDNYLK